MNEERPTLLDAFYLGARIMASWAELYGNDRPLKDRVLLKDRSFMVWAEVLKYRAQSTCQTPEEVVELFWRYQRTWDDLGVTLDELDEKRKANFVRVGGRIPHQPEPSR